ncbi:MAG: ATP-dependent DNA ligase [Frankiales bacterium]|nr:ATP-dependent DNA ligase [Frankiales bacterium]
MLDSVVRASADVGATSSRTAKAERVAALLRDAGPDEAAVVVPWLSGELRQRRTGVGFATLRDAPPPASVPSLTVREVDAAFALLATVAGAGAAAERRRIVHDIWSRATAAEQRLLAGLISGELRQGALEGVMVEAVARATSVPIADVRRAAMLCGAVAPVAEAAMRGGAAALAAFRLQVGRPVQPMLAGTAASVPEAMERLGTAALDWKLDGIRAQLHKDGDDIAVFTRSLDDVTSRVPELVAAVAAFPARTLVLDGEAIALRSNGRPRPFQETGARAATRSSGAPVPLSLFVFDVLHAEGSDVLDLPLSQRRSVMDDVVPSEHRVPSIVTALAAEAAAFFDETVRRGHEGVVAKSLDAPYEAGRRGAGWLKVKPVHTLDLVVLAAEWGHGRRRGWLSNLHLGARDPAVPGGFVMLGKTFKGLTDELLRWQTAEFLAREVERNDWQVFVRPELVVEIAFDGVQTSPRYPGGVALRFARVLRYRDDKTAAEADTIDTVRAFIG